MRRSVSPKDSAAPLSGTATDTFRVSLPAGNATTVSNALLPSVRVNRITARSMPTCASTARSKPGASESCARCTADGPVLSLVQLNSATSRRMRGMASARRLMVEATVRMFFASVKPAGIGRLG